MTFTDEELNVVKSIIEENKDKYVDQKYWTFKDFKNGTVAALLARLEAVERYARDMAAEYPDRFPQEYEAWRTSAGRMA